VARRAGALALAALLSTLTACATLSPTPMTIDTGPQDFEPLWNYGQPAESEVRFREALARAEPESEAQLQLLTQIARTHSLRHNFAEAHALLDQVEPHLPTATKKIAVRHALERGRTFNSAGDKRARKRSSCRRGTRRAAGSISTRSTPRT
jgi:hypothetical protein